MKEMAMAKPRTFDDSSGIRDDAPELRRRLADDGYLFFPGLLPSERVLQVRAEVLDILGAQGWLAEGSDPADARGGAIRTDRDASWWEGFSAVLALESFNRLAHEPALTGIMRRVLGDDLVVHPQKIARITFPASAYPTPPHQDFIFIQGTADVLTSWIPLGDCPAELGGLRVLSGSHREGLHGVTRAEGVGNLTSEAVDPDDSRWRGTDGFRCGDVLVFHSLTVHYAPPNEGDRLRLSVDYRFQSASDPVAPGVLVPTAYETGNVKGWWALTKGWSTTEWCEVAHPIRIVRYSVDPLATPRSRLFDQG